jgi:hypothetical protein
MKTRLERTAMLLLALSTSPLAFAGGSHDHDHDHDHGNQEIHDDHHHAGPNGGHVVDSKAGFSIEVTTDKDRIVRIVFLDRDHKPVALGEQSISGIAGERSSPTKLAFAKGEDAEADVLIADKPLPAGDHVALILVVKTAPDAKTVTERLVLDLH